MPKKYRLSGKEIRKLAGKRLHGALFSLLVAALPGAHGKCACVVSKKAARKAVDRNLIKRRCRAALGKRLNALRAPRALVFYAKRDAHGATFAQVERDIEALLERADRLHL